MEETPVVPVAELFARLNTGSEQDIGRPRSVCMSRSGATNGSVKVGKKVRQSLEKSTTSVGSVSTGSFPKKTVPIVGLFRSGISCKAVAVDPSSPLLMNAIDEFYSRTISFPT